MRNVIPTLRKTIELIGRDNLVPAIGVLFGAFVASAFEVMGLSLILGVLTVLIMDGGASSQLPQIIPVDWLRSVPLWLVMAGIFGAYVLKGACVLTLRWLTSLYIAKTEARFATRMLALYLNAPYAESTRVNSAHVLQKIEQQTSAVFGGMVLSTITMLSNVIMLTGTCGLLLMVDPLLIGMGISIFAVFTPLYLGISGPVSRRLGHRAGELGKAYTKLLQEALHALKEIHVTDTAPFFVGGFERRRMDYADVRSRKTFMAALAPVAMELLAVTAVLLLLYGVVQLRGSQGSIVLMGTFAAAMSRMIGYINGIITDLNQFSYARPATEELHADMLRLSGVVRVRELSGKDRMAFVRQLSVDGVSYSHTGDHRAHLDGISIEIPFGATVALVGPSGAGKSTLVDVIVGLLPPDSGSVLVDGRPIGADPPAWRAAIGYVSQTFYLIDDTIRRNVALGVPDDRIDDAKVLRALRDAGMETFLAAQPDGLDTRVGDRGQQISGGQRQRIAIARALYREPSLLILDEATSALDPATEGRILDEVQALKARMSIILVTHRLAAAARCDRVYYLRDGRIVHHGSYDQVESATRALGDDFFARAN